MRAHSRRVWSLTVVLSLLVPSLLTAQRRPGVGMGFYTYTGLVSGEVEGGSVIATTSLIEAPWVALSAVGTVPLLRQRGKAWIAAARVTPLSLGNRGSCYVTPETTGCQDTRFEERGALLTGGAFDIRSTLLRVMVGPAYVGMEKKGGRLGTMLRLDYTSPRQGGASPALFFSRTFLGSEQGETAALTTLGVSYRARAAHAPADQPRPPCWECRASPRCRRRSCYRHRSSRRQE